MGDSGGQFLIKKNLKLGDLDAETDQRLLKDCFFDKGDMEVIADTEEPESVVVGRTGSGKSALLLKLAIENDKARVLDPNDISIKFLENSDIIKFFESIGVKLDLFYKLLWRHILTIEFLKLRYGFKEGENNSGILQRLTELGASKGKKKAIEYFNKWNDQFWVETDKHLKEIVEKFTDEVKGEIGVGVGGIGGISVADVEGLTQERRHEVVNKANRVVSQLQIRSLSEVIDVLSEESFKDFQQKYYILIDKLDEDWATTETRCLFVRALIEEVKFFRKLSNTKIVVALREDLLQKVFDMTRGSGFQQEKYESYLYPLKWGKEDLRILIEKRVSEVYKRQYEKRDVKFDEVFPSPKQGVVAFSFMVERTLFRPRDILQFCNECFVASYNKPRVSWRSIRSAEHKYSQKRLQSIIEEWVDHYPSVRFVPELFYGLPPNLKKSSFGDSRINEVASRAFEVEGKDACIEAAEKMVSADAKSTSGKEFLVECLKVAYRVGIIGVKAGGNNPFFWAHIDKPEISKSEINRVEKIKVHKMFYHALDLNLRFDDDAFIEDDSSL
ncbi:P-loop ATPase, Sll1717 family [Halomonas rhizosphaerae]|uniref:DNA repair protein n=1 Tax=Halomonas rhizosphaerae TaxID=3043296 RepID=A0ABT6UW98_9GAMM|nr:hypothetical protein [Halomonas rhizosphaerae]MDI5890252.1 hypothetical protein [Halomonas rhizosphaerae]